jgi:SAM-dependent methyltransferase
MHAVSSAQPEFMPAEERHRRARSFAGVAAEYDRGRPGYPSAAIEWALGPATLDVVDVGAGTGKLTEAVLAAGHRVTAVEPLAEMRTLLESRAPGARALEGRAEWLPLAESSVDAVVVGAAFHWFEQEAALAEIERVLRRPGTFALFGNSFDLSRPWVARLREILGPATLGRPGHWPEAARLERSFEEVQDASFGHTQLVDLAQLRDYASSRSGFAVLAPEERRARLSEIDALWEQTPELSGRAVTELPWSTRVRRARGPRA